MDENPKYFDFDSKNFMTLALGRVLLNSFCHKHFGSGVVR
jgi:hypothetical protein